MVFKPIPKSLWKPLVRKDHKKKKKNKCIQDKIHFIDKQKFKYMKTDLKSRDFNVYDYKQISNKFKPNKTK